MWCADGAFPRRVALPDALVSGVRVSRPRRCVRDVLCVSPHPLPIHPLPIHPLPAHTPTLCSPPHPPCRCLLLLQGDVTEQCACFKEDLVSRSRRMYEACHQHATTCQTSPPDEPAATAAEEAGAGGERVRE